MNTDNLSEILAYEANWKSCRFLHQEAERLGVKVVNDLRTSLYLWHLAACVGAGISSLGMRIDGAVRFMQLGSEPEASVPLYLKGAYGLSASQSSKLLSGIAGTDCVSPKSLPGKIDSEKFCAENMVSPDWLKTDKRPSIPDWLKPYTDGYLRNQCFMIETICLLNDRAWDLERPLLYRMLYARLRENQQQGWEYLKYFDVSWLAFRFVREQKVKLTMSVEDIAILKHLAWNAVYVHGELSQMNDGEEEFAIAKMSLELITMQGTLATNALSESLEVAEPVNVITDLETEARKKPKQKDGPIEPLPG